VTSLTQSRREGADLIRRRRHPAFAPHQFREQETMPRDGRFNRDKLIAAQARDIELMKQRIARGEFVTGVHRCRVCRTMAEFASGRCQSCGTSGSADVLPEVRG
jgi:hypothetical protein